MRDGAKQPIVCVHRPTKAFLKWTLVLSSSSSEHWPSGIVPATFHQTMCLQDCIIEFHFWVWSQGNGIL